MWHYGNSHLFYVCRPCHQCGGGHYDNYCPTHSGNDKPVTTSSKSQETPVQGNIKPPTPSTNIIIKQTAATIENYRRIEGEKRRLL